MFSEDLSAFFNSNEFAVAATFKGTTTVKGIFGNAYVEVNHVESLKPTFTCALEAVAEVGQGDTLLIEATTYNIVAVRPDGTGIITLVLERQ